MSQADERADIEFSLNDGKWLNESQLPFEIEDYLQSATSPTKSWFKARNVAEGVDASAQAIGAALAAMYRSDDFEYITERRSANGCWVYRVVLE